MTDQIVINLKTFHHFPVPSTSGKLSNICGNHLELYWSDGLNFQLNSTFNYFVMYMQALISIWWFLYKRYDELYIPQTVGDAYKNNKVEFVRLFFGQQPRKATTLTTINAKGIDCLSKALNFVYSEMYYNNNVTLVSSILSNTYVYNNLSRYTTRTKKNFKSRRSYAEIQ